MKHAPIGPTMAVADVKPDGTVHIYTHNQNPQALRGEIAMMLGIARSCDRACLSRARPLRKVERRKRGRGRRGGAFVASAGQAGAGAVDARRRHAVVHAIVGGLLRRSAGHRRQRQNGGVSDRPLHARHAGRRPIGAVLAGLPTMPAPNPKGEFISSTVNSLQDPWVYDGCAER
jgi:nicotinate dehydrogenase subunit B